MATTARCGFKYFNSSESSPSTAAGVGISSRLKGYATVKRCSPPQLKDPTCTDVSGDVTLPLLLLLVLSSVVHSVGKQFAVQAARVQSADALGMVVA